MSTGLTTAVGNLAAVNALHEASEAVVARLREVAAAPSQGAYSLGYAVALKDVVDILHAKAKAKMLP